jgi:uncharacterized membrane protein YeaQ/YmgE (transglycosylase-associated protein family)
MRSNAPLAHERRTMAALTPRSTGLSLDSLGWLAPCYLLTTASFGATGHRFDHEAGSYFKAIILFIIFGFVIGLLARALLPGRQSMGLVATTLLGIAGSFMGGFLVSLFTHRRVTDFHTAGVIGSIVGAIVLLALVSRFSRRGALA